MKKYKPDFGDGSGDPTTDEELAEEGGPTWHRHSDRQEMEQALKEHIDGFDAEAARAGIVNKPWFHDESADEYHSYSPGLPDEIKRDEYARGKKKFEGTSRQELDGARDDYFVRADFVEGLYEDFLDLYGGDYSSEEVGQAAQRVAERYRIDGSRNVARKINKNRDAFLDDVSTELVMSGGPGHGSEPGAGRTQGTGSYGGHASRGPMKDSDEGKPITEEIKDWQRKSGYY